MVHSNTIVIVGPNRGDYKIARLCAQHTEAWLIEPMPDAVAWHRMHNQCDNVHVVQAACGVTPGRSVMTLYNGGLSSSLGRCTAQAREVFSDYDLDPQGTIEVDVINLAEYLESQGVTAIRTLMIDAQGMDLGILGTMRQWLAERRIKTIICEVDHDCFRHYDDTPPNNRSAFMEFMAQYPWYEYQHNPADDNKAQADLCWILS